MYFKGLLNSRFGWDATSNGSLKTEQCDEPAGSGITLPDLLIRRSTEALGFRYLFFTESLILAQNERWRHGLGMQVEREVLLRQDRQWRKGE